MLIALVVAVPVAIINGPVVASPSEDYDGPFFGDGNLPPECIADRKADSVCHHMRTGLNALDSPQIDVAVLIPVSPTAERDMRTMRQAVEMWEGGIDYLAAEMGLDWLAEGVEFHITLDYIDLTGDGGGEFTTYPLVDPEIVVIATNAFVVAHAGIGIDPLDAVGLTIAGEDGVPCHNIDNPFDFEYWDGLPGFDSHHDSRTGTYTEDCGGKGGNVCFAVNGGGAPAPTLIETLSLFDLVAHEFGHCLTVGHVGDGLDGRWGNVPKNDIMAYDNGLAGLTKCVSTLDVEGFALRMSNYLDVDGDGGVTEADRLEANVRGDGSDPFQVQHPGDHLYASSTGAPEDCPQPDLGEIPGARTDWTPVPESTTAFDLDVTSPDDGATSDDGTFQVAGTVTRRAIGPTEPTATHDDADDDASTAMTEIKEMSVAVTDAHVSTTISLVDLWPSTTTLSPTSYSVEIDRRRFSSFIRYPSDLNPMTWDSEGAYLPPGSSTWDLEAKTVTFNIPRSLLSSSGITAPYKVSTTSNVGVLATAVRDDRAPDAPETVGVAEPAGAGASAGLGLELPLANAAVETFQRDGGNTFQTEDSSFGERFITGKSSTAHVFRLDVPERSDVEFSLGWTETVGGTDLDLYVTGAADSGYDGATGVIDDLMAGSTEFSSETVVIRGVQGTLDISVDPYFVPDPVNGTTYTLTATSVPAPADEDPTADTDGDGVPDSDDACPTVSGSGDDGCPVAAAVESREKVRVVLDGTVVATQDVDTTGGSDVFDMTVDVPQGEHDLRIEWLRRDDVLAVATRTVRHVSSGPDADGDGVTDASDNCLDDPNADQADLDQDGRGDACDTDIDGDGHSNGKERAHGTDPRDPSDFPRKPNGSSTGAARDGEHALV